MDGNAAGGGDGGGDGDGDREADLRILWSLRAQAFVQEQGDRGVSLDSDAISACRWRVYGYSDLHPSTPPPPPPTQQQQKQHNALATPTTTRPTPPARLYRAEWWIQQSVLSHGPVNHSGHVIKRITHALEFMSSLAKAGRVPSDLALGGRGNVRWGQNVQPGVRRGTASVRAQTQYRWRDPSDHQDYSGHRDDSGHRYYSGPSGARGSSGGSSGPSGPSGASGPSGSRVRGPSSPSASGHRGPNTDVTWAKF